MGGNPGFLWRIGAAVVAEVSSLVGELTADEGWLEVDMRFEWRFECIWTGGGSPLT